MLTIQHNLSLSCIDNNDVRDNNIIDKDLYIIHE